MGVVNNIDYDKFPKQGEHKDRNAKICFKFGSETIKGVIVRDDAEEPFMTIIKLEDDRYVLASECQYSVEN